MLSLSHFHINSMHEKILNSCPPYWVMCACMARLTEWNKFPSVVITSLVFIHIYMMYREPLSVFSFGLPTDETYSPILLAVLLSAGFIELVAIWCFYSVPPPPQSSIGIPCCAAELFRLPSSDTTFPLFPSPILCLWSSVIGAHDLCLYEHCLHNPDFVPNVASNTLPHSSHTITTLTRGSYTNWNPQYPYFR